ncbi:uncharacterized protein LOC123443275 [Hordeum vulgare subsp. vulgare]|uniref:uncharacterized protein LOC123443275 n=1 Tax=Hordeum vulgare subsp. vulgare TaxID=112509 RepID=UPI00162E5F6C|nr:uncharacterized protein LOC123443275 [Hordeum vulgare subsp. vulgare]
MMNRVEVPAIGAAASGFLPGQENYIIHMISQLSNDFIAEQRRLQDDNSRLLQEVKDMRRELISGKDLVAESRRVLEENVKIYQEVKDSSTTMKAHVVSESNKVTKEVQEFREEIRGMTENCRLYLGKLVRIIRGTSLINRGPSNHTSTTPRFVNEVHQYGYIPGA